MNIFIFFIFFLFCIIFIPIPLKLHLSFVNYKLTIKFYNIQLYPNVKRENSKRKISKQKKKQNKKKLKKFKIFTKEDLSYSLAKKVLFDLNSRRFKPSLILQGYIDYSCGDSKNTALTFGFIHSFLPYIHRFIFIFFKNKSSLLKINPIFKDSIFIESKVKCIMKVSLGQIIYIGIIFLKNVYLKRRCSL